MVQHPRVHKALHEIAAVLREPQAGQPLVADPLMVHVPVCEDRNGILCLNPGSVSIPKEDSSHSYMSFEEGLFQWKDMDGKIYKEYRLED